MDSKYFTDIRNDILDNDVLSLGAKGLYCLICYELTVSLRKLLLNPDTKAQTIEYANELMKYDYAHFDNLEKCVDKKSYLVLVVQITIIFFLSICFFIANLVKSDIVPSIF